MPELTQVTDQTGLGRGGVEAQSAQHEHFDRQAPRQGSKRKCMLIFVLLFIVAAIAIGVGVGVSLSKKGSSSSAHFTHPANSLPSTIAVSTSIAVPTTAAVPSSTAVASSSIAPYSSINGNFSAAIAVSSDLDPFTSTAQNDGESSVYEPYTPSVYEPYTTDTYEPYTTDAYEPYTTEAYTSYTPTADFTTAPTIINVAPSPTPTQPSCANTCSSDSDCRSCDNPIECGTAFCHGPDADGCRYCG